MKSLLFAHDDWVSFDENGRPVSLNYSRNLVDRYRYLADYVVFAVRGNAPRAVQWFDDAEINCLPDMKHGLNPMRSFVFADNSSRTLCAQRTFPFK